MDVEGVDGLGENSQKTRQKYSNEVDGMGENSQKLRQKYSKCACSWGCGVTTKTFFIEISTSRCIPIVMGNTMHVLKQ